MSLSDPRKTAWLALTGTLVFGTVYSVVYKTYLDTSNPLLAQLPHPQSTVSYWARKSNILNVYFIKYAWGWTSAAFLLSWVTSPAPVRQPSRILKWVLETMSWMIFTSWFFGPALFERVIIASGGECFLYLPSDAADGPIPLPIEMCHQRTPISHASHPHLFTESFVPPQTSWNGSLPRLKKGHDISGHVFLLTMSILFLSDQLRPSLRVRSAWSGVHALALGLNVVLIGIWLFSSYTTSVYFHSPLEKVTGYSKSPSHACAMHLKVQQFSVSSRLRSRKSS